MTRVTVEVLYQELSQLVFEHEISGLVDRTHGGGTPQIHLRSKLLVYLWHMASKITYREVANMFGICDTVCCDAVHAISKTFSQFLISKVIRWPTHQEKIEIAWTIEEAKGYPYVIGMVDGTHISVQKPRDEGVYYYNRKDFYSIVLQGVCREDMRFTDINVGFPGRVHDARVFSNSPLFHDGVTRCGDFVLLGDSAYPLLPWLLTPYKNNQQLTNNMTRYNQIHSSVRVTIERAFALLKGRFRRLKHIEQHQSESMCYLIGAACCLHNICIIQDDIGDYFDDDIDGDEPICLLPAGIFNNAGRELGIMKRNRIMHFLANE